MIFLDRSGLVGRIGLLSQGRGGWKPTADRLVEHGRLFLERAYLLPWTIHDRLGDGFLTAPRINGHTAARDSQERQAGRNGRDCVRLFIDFHLSQDPMIRRRPRADQVNGVLP